MVLEDPKLCSAGTGLCSDDKGEAEEHSIFLLFCLTERLLMLTSVKQYINSFGWHFFVDY